MNETLEALAQSLFKSWFVDATQSALPKGWRESTSAKKFAIVGGSTPIAQTKPSFREWRHAPLARHRKIYRISTAPCCGKPTKNQRDAGMLANQFKPADSRNSSAFVAHSIEATSPLRKCLGSNQSRFHCEDPRRFAAKFPLFRLWTIIQTCMTSKAEPTGTTFMENRRATFVMPVIVPPKPRLMISRNNLNRCIATCFQSQRIPHARRAARRAAAEAAVGRVARARQRLRQAGVPLPAVEK